MQFTGLQITASLPLNHSGVLEIYHHHRDEKSQSITTLRVTNSLPLTKLYATQTDQCYSHHKSVQGLLSI